MPWTTEEVGQFKSGLTQEQKEEWVSIANGYLEECEKSQEVCEQEAIQLANSQVGDSMSDRELRVDTGIIREKKYDKDENVLTTKVDITKAQVLPYRGADGEIHKELIPPGELSKSNWLNSIPNKPVTDTHPPDMLNMETLSTYGRGVLHLDPSYKDGIVTVKETITDEELIQEILDGEKEQVSIGRWATLVEESGTFDGVEYEYKQTDLELNHLAHVREGRAGSDIKAKVDKSGVEQRVATVRVDGSTIPGAGNSDKTTTKYKSQEGDPSMENPKLTIGDTELELSGEITEDEAEGFQGEIDAMLNRVRDTENKLDSIVEALDIDEEDSAEDISKKIEDLKAKKDQAEGEKDALEQRVDDLTETVEDLEGRALTPEKQRILSRIQDHKSDYDPEDKTTKDMKVDLLNILTDIEGLEDKKEAYLDGVMNQLDIQERQPVGDNIVKPDPDDGGDDELQEKYDKAVHQYNGK